MRLEHLNIWAGHSTSQILNKQYSFMRLIIRCCAIVLLALLGSRGAMAQGVAHNTTGAAAHASAMLDVASTNKGVLVPRMTGAQKWAISSPATGLMVFQTDSASGFYYYTGSAWSAVGGSTLPTGENGQILQLVDGVPTWVTPPSLLSVGMQYQGGVIAYILQPADPGYSATRIHGLIAATIDQSTGAMNAPSGCSGTTTGATLIVIGTGAANTNAILASCSTAGIAAKLCHDYTGGGYSDWYLPSVDELNKLYINLSSMPICGFFSEFYWSSSEVNSSTALCQSFIDGTQFPWPKSALNHVRAVRSF